MNKTGVAIVDHVGLKAGMECYDLELFSALKNAGCAPIVFSNFSNPGEGIIPAFDFRVKENVFSFLGLFSAYDRIAAEIKNKEIKYCILHGFRFGFWEWVMVQKIKRSVAKIFLVVHDAGSLVGKNSTFKWKKRIFELCDRIVVHNKFSCEQLSKELSDAEKEKLSIISHGNFIKSAVHPPGTGAFLREHNLPVDRKYLLFFGQIKETKGLDLLLEAFSKIDSSIDLIIAGRMRKHSFAQYQELIERYKLQSRVKLFIEYISTGMRNELFHLVDAVVLPYRKVYQSGVMLMAMSYAKAVIASDLPPNIEIITDGENGFLFEAENSDELAKVLNKVMESNEKREKVAKNGFQFVSQKLDSNKIALEWVKLFHA